MYSLLSHNTFGIDVYAERFQEYASVEELKTLIAQGALTTPFLHIGGGSNLLFVKDYEGLVLHSRIEGIEVTEEDERRSVRCPPPNPCLLLYQTGAYNNAVW